MSEDRPAGTTARRIKVYGSALSSRGYEIRDFLARSVIGFEWVELRSDEEARHLLGICSLRDPRLPLAEMPDGTLLFGASLREVAEQLGFVARPKLSEYDLSIYGAGPAGLSAAVYAASEGLKVVLIERDAVGGQAGSSSLI